MGWGFVGDLANGAKNAVGGAADFVSDKAKDVGGAFDSALDKAGDFAKDAGRAVGKTVSNASFSDIGHTVLDVAGMVPVIGEAADLANAAWYLAEGDKTNAALSAAGAIPFLGNGATAAKWGKKAYNAAEVATDVAKAGNRVGDVAKAADTASGVSKAGGKPLLQTGAGAADPSKLADEAYDVIRASSTDVNAIAKSTGYKPDNIQKVKDHLFNNEHVLDRYVDLGVPATVQRFDSNIDIANSWRRLENGTHTPKDTQLLKHETAEAWHMRKHGSGYSAAHEAAQRRFPSGLE